jgi:putative ABC transport system substrate-binding protein
MKRRELITMLGSAAAAWPIAARAQQPRLPLIGYIGSTPEADVNRLRAFRQGLGEAGFVEGGNVTIEYRWNETTPARRPELAADLIRRQVRVIIAVAPMAAVVKAATSTIPIIFWGAPDAVQVGLVASLNRPGANVTGVTTMGTEVGGKGLASCTSCCLRCAAMRC